MVLRIERFKRQKLSVFTLSGVLDEQYIPELQRLFGSSADPLSVIVDLGGVTLIDRPSVLFLADCEKNGLTLERCPEYIRQWINSERTPAS